MKELFNTDTMKGLSEIDVNDLVNDEFSYVRHEEVEILNEKLLYLDTELKKVIGYQYYEVNDFNTMVSFIFEDEELGILNFSLNRRYILDNGIIEIVKYFLKELCCQ